jgi:tetratricopeptide (TPR) repeat protein
MRQQGEFPQFVSRVREAAAKNPSSSSLQYTLGNLLAQQGDTQAARGAFESAKAGGGAAASEIELAVLDMRAGAPDKARDRLLNLVKSHDSVRARVMLAEIEMQKGSGDAPVQQYLKALQLEPGNVLVMNNLAGYLATRQKKFDDAIFWAQKALALSPGSPVIEDTLGWSYYMDGKYAQAVPYLEKSLAAKDRPLAHYHLAAGLMKAGDSDRGRKEFDKAVQADPKSEERALVAPLFGR